MTNPAEALRDSVPHLNRVPAAEGANNDQPRVHPYLARGQNAGERPDAIAAYHAEDPVPLHGQPPPPEPPTPAFGEGDAARIDFSYVYRPEAMAPQRRIDCANEGWRGLLNRRLHCHLAPRPAERTQRAALAMVRSSFPASRTICVANVKGGSGKTPTALILAELLATLRRESIVAADLNELRGTLGVRADVQRPAYTVMDLLQYEGWLSRPGAAVGDLAGFLRRQESGALILASSENAGEMRSLTADHCQAVRGLLMTRYSTVVIDTGNNEAAPPWQFATRVADVLVVPLRASSDHVWVAGRMLDGLHKRNETRHLPPAAIALITDQDGARLDPTTEQWLAERVRAVLYVPPDPEISAGSIRADRLSPASRAAWTLVAAAVAEVCARPSIHDYLPAHS